MQRLTMKHSLVAAFTLAGAIGLSPVSQTLAAQTVVTLGNGDAATVQGGGTQVEADGSGNVTIYVNGDGEVTVYTDSGIAVLPAVNDATATGTAPPSVGDKLADGTIYAGDNLAVMPADAPGSGLWSWDYAKKFCETLVASGHDDWRLPGITELGMLFDNRASIGGFKSESYWSSTETSAVMAWLHGFSDVGRATLLQKHYPKNVRCVR